MSPCQVVRYRRLNRREPSLQVFGSQFCAECPDVDRIPPACDMSCDPGADRFALCRRTAACPCARDDSEARQRAFAAWLMARLEQVRLRERALLEGRAAADGRTASAWRGLARALLDAPDPAAQHQALSRWAEAVLAGGGAREQERLAALLGGGQAGAEAGGEAPPQALEALTPRQRWALARARAGRAVDSRDIAAQFGVSREQGRLDLVLLAQFGLLVRRGASRATAYVAPEQAAAEEGGANPTARRGANPAAPRRAA